MSEYGNIDELLTTSTNTTAPDAPEHETVEEDNNDANEVDSSEHDTDESDSIISGGAGESGELEEEREDKREYDAYGNEKPAPKTYTEDEVNEKINKAVRERLARGNPQQPNQQAVQQQAKKDFEYNPESDESWQQQLELFVEQTVSKMSQKQYAQQEQQRENQAHEEFQDKFTQGMGKFGDFKEVVGSQPITDPMTLALRGMQDPASFIYAASKRHPAELTRISQIPDKYSQMVEMGKLEERMRKSPVGTTKAPRPVSRTSEDTGLPASKKKSEPSIEDLIAKSEARKLALVKQRRAR